MRSEICHTSPENRDAGWKPFVTPLDLLRSSGRVGTSQDRQAVRKARWTTALLVMTAEGDAARFRDNAMAYPKASGLRLRLEAELRRTT